METIIINNQAYSKNVELINSLNLINAWCLINRFEYNIQTITDIKDVLTIAMNEAKAELDRYTSSYPNINDMDEYIYRNYEQTCESWSCYGLDLDKLSN